MVFSIWIRRRDAHSFNRSFIHGIPVFYDHEAGFLAEKCTRTIDGYFSVGPDPDYAGLWRLNLGEHDALDTLSLRQEERKRFDDNGRDRYTYFPIRDTALFLEEIKNSVRDITSILEKKISHCIRRAGFNFFGGG